MDHQEKGQKRKGIYREKKVAFVTKRKDEKKNPNGNPCIHRKVFS
jgi:hypothetical protein